MSARNDSLFTTHVVTLMGTGENEIQSTSRKATPGCVKTHLCYVYNEPRHSHLFIYITTSCWSQILKSNEKRLIHVGCCDLNKFSFKLKHKCHSCFITSNNNPPPPPPPPLLDDRWKSPFDSFHQYWPQNDAPTYSKGPAH